jgi:hypothetical protein
MVLAVRVHELPLRLSTILILFRLTSEKPQVRTLLRPPGLSSKDGFSPAETRVRHRLCSPAGFDCSRLTAAGCAQYVPKSVSIVIGAHVRIGFGVMRGGRS